MIKAGFLSSLDFETFLITAMPSNVVCWGWIFIQSHFETFLITAMPSNPMERQD